MTYRITAEMTNRRVDVSDFEDADQAVAAADIGMARYAKTVIIWVREADNSLSGMVCRRQHQWRSGTATKTDRERFASYLADLR